MEEHGAMRELPVGEVTHYWTHLGVAGVHLSEPIDVGDRIRVVGHTSNFEQQVRSMEIDRHQVLHAEAGSDVGIWVTEHAREHDHIYRLVDTAEMGRGEHRI